LLIIIKITLSKILRPGMNPRFHSLVTLPEYGGQMYFRPKTYPSLFSRFTFRPKQNLYNNYMLITFTNPYVRKQLRIVCAVILFQALWLIVIAVKMVTFRKSLISKQAKNSETISFLYRILKFLIIP
jgi:hypothetical protein